MIFRPVKIAWELKKLQWNLVCNFIMMNIKGPSSFFISLNLLKILLIISTLDWFNQVQIISHNARAELSWLIVGLNINHYGEVMMSAMVA